MFVGELSGRKFLSLYSSHYAKIKVDTGWEKEQGQGEDGRKLQRVH